MSYILMLVFFAGYGPREDIRFQEFSSEATCLLALGAAKDAWRSQRDSVQLVSVECLKK